MRMAAGRHALENSQRVVLDLYGHEPAHRRSQRYHHHDVQLFGVVAVVGEAAPESVVDGTGGH